MIYKRIGAKIREAREEANISQKELASKIGYESATAISLIESGDRKVSVDKLEKAAKILRKNIVFFLADNELIRPAAYLTHFNSIECRCPEHSPITFCADGVYLFKTNKISCPLCDAYRKIQEIESKEQIYELDLDRLLKEIK